MNREPLTPVAEDDVLAFQRDGVVCLRRKFDEDWLDLARAGAERNMREPGPYAHTYAKDDVGHVFFNDVANWERIPEFEHVLVHSPAGRIAARMMASRTARVFYDSVFYRTSGTRARTPWHQDQPYWCVEGRAVCSLWLPLDPVPRASALEFVRGSTAWNATFYRKSFFADGAGTHAFESAPDARARDEAALDRIPDIDTHPERYDLLAWEMEPGDCLVFSGTVVHGGSGNLAEGRRLRALAARYTGDGAIYRPDKLGGTDPDLRHTGHEPGRPFDGPHFPLAWPRS